MRRERVSPGGSAERRRRRRRVAVLGGSVLAVLLAVLTPVTALADCGNVGAAVISGPWQIRVTFDGYTGSPPSSFSRVPGTVTVENSGFLPDCATGVGCGLLLQPTQGQLAFYGASGLEGPDPDHPLIKRGTATYTSTFIPGGVGGPNLPPCRPPRLNRTLSFTVEQAVPSASSATGWSAAVLSGSEQIAVWWSCSGNTGVVSSTAEYTLLAVPAGAAFPTGSTLPCAVAVQASAAPQPSTAAGPTASPPAAAAGSRTLTPSTFSTGLASPGESFGSLRSTLVNLVITLALVLFITFPAQLFNKTLEENYDDIRDIVSRRFGWARRMRGRIARESTARTRLAVFASVILLGALLGSLNDPGFGLNRSSALTYTGVIVSMMVGLYAGTVVTRLYRRARHEDTTGRLHALPAGLLVAGACVVLSRSTHFQPGYLYGVIFGIAFTTTLRPAAEGLGIVLRTATTLALALLAWALWLPVHDRALTDSGALMVIATDVLASLVVGGFVGTVIGLFPLRFMAGGALFRWSRGVWAATFAVSLFGLVQVLLHPDHSPAHSGSAAIVTTVVLFVCFGAASLGFTAYFERRKRLRAAPAVAIADAGSVTAAAGSVRGDAASPREPARSNSGVEPAPAGLGPPSTAQPPPPERLDPHRPGRRQVPRLDDVPPSAATPSEDAWSDAGAGDREQPPG